MSEDNSTGRGAAIQVTNSRGIRIEGGSINDMHAGVSFRNTSDSSINQVQFNNVAKPLSIESCLNVMVGNIEIRNVPPDLLAAMNEARGLPPKDFAERFGDRLKGYGIDVWPAIEKGANVLTIVAAIAQLARG